ncbi:MAG TPA: hypothetical protein VFW28_08390 [Micropepsaceae bacterium]|nr:hypothetical protein [Micropepsaceae bacterium]
MSKTAFRLAATLAGICGAAALLLPALAADSQSGAAIPQFMLPATAGWGANINPDVDPTMWLPDDYLHGEASVKRAISLGAPPNRVTQYLNARMFNEYMPPESGLGPIMDGPEHPFYNNAVQRAIGKNSSYRVADLNSEAAKNLMPWAVDALKKQNALALQGRNGETRQARCWETGVPDIHEAPQALYFIQTPKEIVMYQGGRVRHVYMNVPHTKNPAPSWYGESVGHYDGDTLVVDTVGLNTVTFVDGYRTPHTTAEHVIERFKIVNGGKALDVSFTVDDRGTFYKPWSGRRPRYRENTRMAEDTCAANNDDKFNLGFDPVPTATNPDF